MSVTCSELSFGWPDGDVVFEGLTFVVGPGRSGMVGRNGTGKSTLLRLIAGRLTPQLGTVRHTGSLGYLPQDLTLGTELRVDQALGIHATRQALAAVESGDAAPEHFAVVGDDWDVEERALALLDKLGLDGIGLDRRVGELSGGETVLLGLAAELIKRPGVLLLDEPTNNLDRSARQRSYGAVDASRGALLVVSHDRELLDRVDQMGELRDGRITWYGGNLAAYEQAKTVEQEAAQRMVRVAEGDVRRQQRELVEARTKLDRRLRYAKKMEDAKRVPKIIANARKREAQVSAGKHRNLHIERLETAKETLTEAEALVNQDDDIRIDLPDTAVPAGRTVLRVQRQRLRTGQEVSLQIRGPERIALTGPNGAGKTTLLQEINPLVPSRLLPQRLDVLDDSLTVVENVARFAEATDNNTRRARLARFLFRGEAADQLVSTLSGGERFRATLAALLLAEPPPQLLMLDEPTNNLDLSSVAQLTSALNSYPGALIVASHDVPFLKSINTTRWLQLDPNQLTDGSVGTE